MITQLAINRHTRNTINAEILDVAEILAAREYGTATQAMVAMIRRSPLFQETVVEVRQSKPRKARK